MKKEVIKSGDKFNRLTVLHYDHTNSKKSRIYKCECSCHDKNIVYVAANLLRSGNTQSCGCLNNGRGKLNKAWKGFEDISGWWWSNKRWSAKKRKIPWNITIEEAWNQFILQSKKCILTGLDLYFGKDVYDDSHGNGTASIDRKNSSIEYNKDNIQFVHKDINRMKMDYDQDYYIKMCCLVTKYNNKEEYDDKTNDYW